MFRKRGSLIGILIVVAGILLALFAWQVMQYRAALRVLPEGTTVAGMDVGGRTIDAAIEAVGGALVQPIELVYQGELLVLSPEQIEFRFDPEGTRAAIETAVANRHGVDGFFTFLLRRYEPPSPLPASGVYAEERLDAFMIRVAQQYDRPSQPPVPLPQVLTFRAGRPGYRLDLVTSKARTVDALFSATSRRVELVVEIDPAPPLRTDQLEEMIAALTANFAGTVGVFAKDLQTGHEATIDADVAYSAMGVVRIAVALETWRALDGSPTLTQTLWMNETLTGTDDDSPNGLLRDVIGGGDAYQGVVELTESMRYLGLLNTFIAAPYGELELPFAIVTPANSRTDVDVEASPTMQTTAQDIGLLLEMIYQCSRGGGALMVAYPSDFAAQECRQILDTLRDHRTDSLIELGLPPNTPVAHRQGLTANTHGDAAIVFGPSGDFVLVILIYTPGALDWETSNAIMADITTATYNYFNPAE